MIALDIIFTLIEDFILCYTTFSINKINSKKTLGLAILACFIETFILSNIIINNNLILILLPLTISFFIWLNTKTIKLSYFIMPIIIEMLFVFSNTLSMCIVSIIFNISILNINPSFPYIFIPTVILSRVIIILFALVILKIHKIGNSNLPYKIYIVICIFLFSVLLMLNTLISAITYENLSITILFQMIFILLVLCISSMIIFYIILQQNKENEIISKKLMNEKYQRELYAITHRMQSVVSKDIHMMKYSLLKILNLITNHKQDEALIFTKNELSKYMNYDVIPVTNNPLFDFELTTLVYNLKQKNIDLKPVITIQKNTILFNDISILTYLMNTIERICNQRNIKQVQLFVQENPDHYKIKVIIDIPFNNEFEISRHPKLKDYVIHQIGNELEYVFLFMKYELDEEFNFKIE